MHSPSPDSPAHSPRAVGAIEKYRAKGAPRMIHRISVLLAIACLSTGANAAWGLRYQVRLWGGDPWTNQVFTVVPGQVVQFRFGAYFDPGLSITVADGTGAAAAMNRFMGQNQFTGMLAGDVISSISRTISNGNAALTAISGNKIGGTGITIFGDQTFFGGLPNPPQTYVEIYTGTITLMNVVPRTLTFKNNTFGSGNSPGLSFYTYASSNNKQSAAPDASNGPHTDQEATIYFLPSSGAFTLFGWWALLATRRRRR